MTFCLWRCFYHLIAGNISSSSDHAHHTNAISIQEAIQFRCVWSQRLTDNDSTGCSPTNQTQQTARIHPSRKICSFEQIPTTSASQNSQNPFLLLLLLLLHLLLLFLSLSSVNVFLSYISETSHKL